MKITITIETTGESKYNLVDLLDRFSLIQDRAKNIRRDASTLSTGNLSHHKTAIECYSTTILNTYEQLEPIIEQIREHIIYADENNNLANRREALIWWYEFIKKSDNITIQRACDRVLFQRDMYTLTGSEIQKLWEFYVIN